MSIPLTVNIIGLLEKARFVSVMNMNDNMATIQATTVAFIIFSLIFKNKLYKNIRLVSIIMQKWVIFRNEFNKLTTKS